MSLFVVWLELEKLFEGPHGGLGFLPLELQRRELLRRGDELTVGLFALPLDPRRAQVREKFSAMHRHGSSQVLDCLTGSPGILRLATAAQRSAKDDEVACAGVGAAGCKSVARIRMSSGLSSRSPSRCRSASASAGRSSRKSR